MSDYPNTGLAYPTYDKKFGQLVSKCDKKRFGAQIVLKIAFEHRKTLFKDVHKGGGLGLKPPPLSLIFYKNFITFARRLSVFAYILLVILST